MALNAGSIEIKLFANLARLQADMNKANKTVDSAMRNIEKSSQIARRALGGLASAVSFMGIAKLADDFKRFDSQLKLSTGNLKTYTEAFNNVVRISKIAQSDIGAVGVLYARLNNNLREFNVTQAQVAGVTETVSLALRNSNATVQETNSVMLQLSQSFGSGKLNGQEFLAVAEGAPILLRQLANSMGKPFGALKDLSAQSKITKEDLLKAFTDPAFLDAMRNQVKEVGTINSAMTVFVNNLKLFVGEADNATGASNAIRKAIMLLADNINVLATVGIAALIVATARWVAGTLASIQASLARQRELVKEQILLERKIIAENAAAAAIANNARAVTMAAHANSAAMTEQAAVQATLAARMTATATAAGVLRTAVGFLGGPIGAITTLLGVGLTAWLAWGNQGKASADDLASAIERVKNGLESINDAKMIELARSALAVEKLRAERPLRTLDVIRFSSREAAEEDQRVRVAALTKQIKEYDAALQKHNQTKKENNALISEEDKLLLAYTEKNKLRSKQLAEYNEQISKLNILLKAGKISQADYLVEVEKWRKAINDLTGKTKELKAEEKDRQKQIKEFAREQEEILKAQIKARQDELNAIDKQNESIEKQIEQIENNISLAQNGERAFRELEIARLKDSVATAKQIIEQAKLNGATKDAIDYAENYVTALEKQVELKEKANELEDTEEMWKRAKQIEADKVKAAEAGARDLERVNDRVAQSFSDALTNAIMRGFESGKSFAYNFRDSLVIAFKTLVLRPVIDFIINTSGINAVLGSIGGILSGGTDAAAATRAAGGGILDSFVAGGKSIFSAITSGFDAANIAFEQSIQKFGTYLTSFGGAGNPIFELGGMISQYSKEIAIGSSYLDATIKLLSGDVKGAAFSAAGATIGGFIGGGPFNPIGAAIGSFVGNLVGGLFGGGSPKMYGNTATGAFAGGTFTPTGESAFGRELGAGDALTQLNKSFSENFGALLKAFDENVEFTVSSLFRQRTNVRARFDIAMGEKSTMLVGGKYNSGGFEAFAKNVMGTGIIEGIKASNLPQAVKDVFNNIATEFNDATKRTEGVNALINSVIKLQSASVGLESKFGLTTSQALQLGNTVTETNEQLIAFINQLSTVGDTSITVGQRILEIKDSLNQAFSQITGTGNLPSDLNAFDAALKNIDKTTQEGIETFANLLGLRDGFIQFNNAINDLKTGVQASIFGLLTPMEQLTILQGELVNVFEAVNLQVPTSIDELIQLGRSIDFTTEAGLSLAAVFPQLISAFTATEQAAQAQAQRLTEAFNSQYESAQNNLTEAQRNVDLARDNLVRSFDAERSRLQAVIDNVANLKDNLADAINVEKNRYEEIIKNVDNFKTALSQALDVERNRLQAIVGAVGDIKNELLNAINLERNRYQSIIDNVDKFKNALSQAFDLKASGLQSTIDKFKSFGASIRDFRKSLGDTMTTNANPLVSTRNLFEKTIALALQGDETALSNIEKVSNDYLDITKEYSGNFVEYQKAFALVSNALLEVENSALSTASVAELQLEALNQQVSSLISVDQNIVSVEQAIANLLDAQNKATLAQVSIEKLNEIQLKYLGTSNEALQSVDAAIEKLLQGQSQANAAQSEIERLNILQTELLGTSNDSVVSVNEAIANLAQAQNQAAQAQIEINRLNQIQAQYLGVNNETLMSVNEAIAKLTQGQNESNAAQQGINNLNTQQNAILNEINDSVLSVADAILQLNNAAKKQTNAQIEVDTAKSQLDMIQAASKAGLTPESIYKQFLGREADAEGLAYWKKEFGSNVDLDELRVFQNAVRQNLALGLETSANAVSFAAMRFANGGVFTNGIVSSPTAFNTGLMGEAGPEAIMPLTSINGQLGVTTNNSEMVKQLEVISEKISRLESAQIATAQNTGKVARIIERADNGDSLNVTVVTE